MAKDRPKESSCSALARILRDFCSCSENAAWSPDMTSDRKGPFLKSELTNMSAMRRRIMTIARRKKHVTEQPKSEKKSETLTSNIINTVSSQNSTMRRNIDNFLISRRMVALDEDIYEKPIASYSSYGENWSLSKSWKSNNAEYFNRTLNADRTLEPIDEVPKRKKRNRKMKEQLRYDRNIKRHIRIRVMLSLRMRRYVRRRYRSAIQNVPVPPRKFPRGASVTSSFGTRSYRSVMTDKTNDGTVLFDIHEARNTTMELCHNYDEDLDTLDIALRAGNFRSGRLAVEGWWCGRAMPGGRANNGALALHYAAARGCLDCVRLLANTTPDVSANTAMDNDVTPVYLAAQEGHLAVLKYLVLEAGGRLDARARDGMLPIHAAAQTGCLDCVKWMIVERGVDPNARDGDGATPLHFAASRGHLSTVRWLLRHGARLHLDRHGKSPINDAAENHHLECLNVLVAAGAAGDNKQLSSYKAVHSCACTPGETRCALSSCINASNRSPFYLHGPERCASTRERRGSVSSTVGSIGSSRSGPADGLYVNPMQRTAPVAQHSSSGEESSGCSASEADTTNSGGWFLHGSTNTSGAPAALYQRVRDLFHTRSPGPRVPAEVKAEVHGTKEVAQEQSDSDSGADANRRDHHYEDIYLARDEHHRKRSSSRDSGSHSRPGSAALVVDYDSKDNAADGSNKNYEEVSPPPLETQTKSTIATKLAALTHKAQNFASRISSAAGSRRASVSDDTVVVQASASSGVSSGGSSGDEAPPPPPPPPPPVVLEEPALKPSELRSRLGGRRDSTCADDDRPRCPNLVNKQPALPFVPPAFPHNAPDRLIKPSEYLKTITAPCKRDEGAAEARPPPPPPAPQPIPPPPPQPPVNNQPLAAISSAELSAVRLKTTVTKTVSAPPTRSLSLQCLPSAAEIYKNAKTDLIEELKMSKDITGIKKMKVERARRESLQDKETFTEFTKRFTADNFVDQGNSQIPERDAAGNVIPVWKRQMMARRAAEKARRDLERELAGEAERRRAAAVPAWKRQLLARREEAECRLRQSLYTPKVEDNGNGDWRPYPAGGRAVSIDNITLCYDAPAQPTRAPSEMKLSTEHCNGHTNGKPEREEESAKIIPWRAQLRKTNSKLNLLE
ncbi:espin isoform X3 [Pieris rapae]|uniref:espin isoform X3 n=1 Tax=Pieris rapae TaxID=64459 RepID=UPI001E27CEB5|nr:espin isoform X3 [Pieris rapae]